MGSDERDEVSMESLLQEQAELQSGLDKGKVVWVKVIAPLADQILVDIGEKREAVIPASEFPQGSQPKAGQRLPAVLLSRGYGEKPTKLSTVKARWLLGWEQLVKAFSEKSRVRGRVTSAVKGGFLVDVAGVTGFLPASQADLRPVRKPESMVGMGIRCYVLSLDQNKQQIVLSRKLVLEEEIRKRRQRLMAQLKKGDVRVGRVVRVLDSGILVDIGSLVGRVVTADIAWKEAEQAKAKLSRGQKVRVQVLKVDTPHETISLGMKQLTPHPADTLKKKYPPKSVVRGPVLEILPQGVRIRLSDSAMAFCPVAELPVEGPGPRAWDGPGKAQEATIWPKVGSEVSGIVLGIHSTTFDVTISIRQYEKIQERKQVARYLKGSPPLTLGQLLNPDLE